MDTGYAERKLMMHIEDLGKVYYYPLKANRLVNDTAGQQPHQRVDLLEWSAEELKHGKLMHIKDFPKDHQVKLCRLAFSTERTDFIATTDLAPDSSQGTHEVCALRWKIEQFHREAKQITDIERCQCRLAHIQRNHIACSLFVSIRFKDLAQQVLSTVYHLKYSLLGDYMRSQLRSPTITMQFA